MNELEWSKLVESIGPSLYRYFLGSFPSELSSELVQETLIRLIKKHESNTYQEHLGSITSFAFGIARYVRLENLKPNRIDFDDNFKVDELAEPLAEGPSDEVARLRMAIKKLKPIEQEIILLLINDEFTLEEISIKLSIPTGTVKSHIHRAKEKLKIILGEPN